MYNQTRTPSIYPHAKPEMDNSADNVYVNVLFNNISGTSSIPASSLTTYSVPILDSPDNYYCSIVRFDIPLSRIPLFICPIIPNQVNPDLTPFIIGIDYLGVKYPVNIDYVSYSNYATPVQDKPYQVVTPYYYMSSVQQFLDIINTALKTAVNDSAFPMAGLNYPYFYFESGTELIKFVFPSQFITSVNVPLIFMNEMLYTWISGFSVERRYGSTVGNDYYLQLTNNLIAVNSPFPGVENLVAQTTTFPVTYPLSGSAKYYVLTQEYKTINNNVAVKKIFVTSTSLPITPEFTPPASSGSSSSTLPIISDFIPNISSLADCNSVAFYYPVSQYKLVDMTSNTPIRYIDLRILWQDRYGNDNVLELPPGSQANVKLIFVKKTLYKSI